MNLNKLLFIFSVLFALGSFAQSKKIDSIYQQLELTKLDSSKTSLLLLLANEYKNTVRVKAFDYANKALISAEKNNQKEKAGECLNYLGDLYWYSGDYKTSSVYYFKALKIYEALKDNSGIAKCYRNIGWIYQGQENYNQAINYHLSSLSLNKELNDRASMLANYDDLSIVYRLKKNYPKSLEYCQLTIQLSKSLKSEEGLASGYGTLGSVYFEMGKNKEAIENISIANELYKKNDKIYNLADSYNGLAECYLATENYSKAIEYAQRALDISLDNKFNILTADSYEKLARAYSKTNEFNKAYNYMSLYTEAKDSSYNEINAQQINEMSAKYEFEKKEFQIKSLESEKTLSDQKLAQEKRFKLYLILFLIVVAIFSLSLIRNIRQKKKTNQSLSDAYQQIEVKNKDITDSINYSKRIQNAILPSEALKFELFKDIFVSFHPKDIVSGDFYWYTEKNGHKLIAACDCTGHGVPGALMSMIGTNFLNQLVNEKEIISPDEILNQLNFEIKKALKQDDESIETRDGMDIALVSINDQNQLAYAGANRPLWIIRSNELIEIKPNKFSIGGLQHDKEHIFEKHIIQTQLNDCIYLFTDGFVDQFGGENGKKFMTKRLKETLLEINPLPMSDQLEKLEYTFRSWRGQHEQVDDVLVIGFRIS
jgi:serine phosphatase RsbU (regulator of sigma subunit)/uncharacterized protein HemY